MTDLDRLLADIAAPERPPIQARTAIVLAHADDETLACGALLPRLVDATLIHVTDGAPRDGSDAARFGFADWPAYAAARRRELEAALAIAGVPAARLVALSVPDQGTAVGMADVARRLVPFLAGREVVLTHAFEGGHPDHDATAFAVRAAAALLRQQGRAPAIVEMPLYRAGPDGTWLRQSFARCMDQGVTLHLSEAEWALKARMLAAHASQSETLAGFDVELERYRAARPRAFTEPPNGGRVLYEAQPWGMIQPRFAELVRAALADLGLADPAV